MNTGSHQDDEGLEAFRTRADRILLAALAAHVVASLCVALWNGSWVPALVLAVPAAIVPALIYRLAPGALVTRLAVAASFMVLTGVLIHQVQGELEAHFGVFVLLALLVLYCDWRPIVMAAAVIAVHHVGFAWMQSAGVAVFVFPQPAGFGRVLVHAVYVVVESGLLCYVASVLRSMVEDGTIIATFTRRASDGHLDFPFPAATNRPVLIAAARMQSELKRTLVEASHAADAMGSVSGRLKATAAELAQRADEQSRSTEAVVAAVEEMTSSIDRINETSGNARQLAGSSMEAARSGARVVKETIDEMSSIAAVISAASRSVEELGSKSERAVEVVNIIKDVADQTNLLALNAAIEAARAGELGRGFAVVADEVRKLAERTSLSTSEITQMMNEMRSAKESVLEGIGDAVSRVESGVSHAGRAGESIGAITEKVTSVDAVVEGISGAMQEQHIASGEISRHVERLTQMAESAAAATAGIATEATTLDDDARKLRDVLSRFRVA